MKSIRYALLRSLASLLFAVLLWSQASQVKAEEATFPQCELQGQPPSGFLNIVHAFGTNTQQYPNEFPIAPAFPAFNQVFDLYLSNGVSNRWTQGQFATLLSSIMSNDTLNTTDDVFGRVWGYFCRSDADLNPHHAGVRFTKESTTYTKMRIYLYDRADVPSPCDEGIYGNACYGYSFVNGNSLYINASPVITLSDVIGLAIAHELQHVCWGANGLAVEANYYSCNETLSTLAEYFFNTWRPAQYDRAYDASFMRSEICDLDSKYDVEKIWIIYLYEMFKASASDPTDDLIYRWIRNAAPPISRMRLSELATVIWDSAYSWVGGGNGTDRLNKAFANFLAAKYANAPAFAPNSRFGVSGVNSLSTLHFFKDNCMDNPQPPSRVPMSPVDCPVGDGYANILNEACWNVRAVPPAYQLSSAHENTMTTVPGASGVYKDRDDTPSPTDGDQSTDWVDVPIYGTDYILFRASTYFADGSSHDLKIRIEGSAHDKSPGYPESKRITPVGWVMGYCCDVSQPQTNPQHLVFIEPIAFSPTTTLGEIVTSEVTITDFGRSVKMVAVAISSTTNSLDLTSQTGPLNYFDYEYEFGVYTPATANVTWSGTVLVNADRVVPASRTLTLQPGTRVRVSTVDRTPGGIDTQKVELNVYGSLIADGTAASPIKFESWTPTTTEDWVGVYFANGTGSAIFDNCLISRAEFAIDSYKPLTVTNTVIEDCGFGGVSARASNSLIQGCTFTRPGVLGAYLAGASTTIRNTTINDAASIACLVNPTAAVAIRNSQFINSDTGLYVNGMAAVSIDSTSAFNTNGIGVHCYGTNISTSIARSTFQGNTVDGILCAAESSPTIQNCQFQSNYVAIYCTGTNTAPALSNNTFNNNVGAVNADVGANPDIGNGGSNGNNTFLTSTGYHVANANAWTVMGRSNYWNSSTPPCFPKASKIVGPVDYNPSLCSNPNPSSPSLSLAPYPNEKVTVGILATTPNPFNPSVTIAFGVPSGGTHVEISIYDVRGQVISELVSGNRPGGPAEVVWDGTNTRGEPVASSVYFVRMSAGKLVDTKKIVLLK